MREECRAALRIVTRERCVGAAGVGVKGGGFHKLNVTIEKVKTGVVQKVQRNHSREGITQHFVE